MGDFNLVIINLKAILAAMQTSEFNRKRKYILESKEQRTMESEKRGRETRKEQLTEP